LGEGILPLEVSCLPDEDLVGVTFGSLVVVLILMGGGTKDGVAPLVTFEVSFLTGERLLALEGVFPLVGVFDIIKSSDESNLFSEAAVYFPLSVAMVLLPSRPIS
jgi:hypothetical protein